MKPAAVAMLFLTCLTCVVVPVAPAADAPGKSVTRTTSSERPAHAATSASSNPGTRAAAPAGGALPDSTVLARVDQRRIRVPDFIRSFFDSDPEFRPKPDSAGRADFLATMVNKEILGLTARAANRPLRPEDQASLDEYAKSVMANVLYQRLVIDSTNVTEDDIRAEFEQYRYDLRLAHILFADRAAAERVQHELSAQRIPWSVAVRKYSVSPDREFNGDMGWRSRVGIETYFANEVFSLLPGQISNVIKDPHGFHLVRVMDRRPSPRAQLESMRTMIRDQIRDRRAVQRTRDIQAQLLAKLSVVYDEPNIAWSVKQFERPLSMTPGSAGAVIEVNPNLPNLDPADRQRVLARYNGGQVTMAQFIQSYGKSSPFMRPTLDSPAAVEALVNSVILEPTMVRLAYDRGLDRDPMAVDLIESKREKFLVEYLFQDSVQSHVKVTPQMRRQYYDANLPGFFTFPHVRFAVFAAKSRPDADSLKARLARGEHADAILLADSLAGIKRGSIQERSQNQHGPYQKVLFEELRPGQITIDGPDKDGDYAVLQLLDFVQGRQLDFAEVENIIDESLRNIAADRILQDLIERHRGQHTIEVHPELLMRVKLETPE